MTVTQATPERDDLPWSVSDIDYASIDVEKVRNNRTLFYLLVAHRLSKAAPTPTRATSPPTTPMCPEAATWLARHWESELQHGFALRRYVEHVWPEFDWPRGYQRLLR